MKEFWFTPKNYGNGFYPSSWQGWLIILIALALICAAFYLSNPSVSYTHLTLPTSDLV